MACIPGEIIVVVCHIDIFIRVQRGCKANCATERGVNGSALGLSQVIPCSLRIIIDSYQRFDTAISCYENAVVAAGILSGLDPLQSSKLGCFLTNIYVHVYRTVIIGISIVYTEPPQRSAVSCSVQRLNASIRERRSHAGHNCRAGNPGAISLRIPYQLTRNYVVRVRLVSPVVHELEAIPVLAGC
jgi:hypothetical protein